MKRIDYIRRLLNFKDDQDLGLAIITPEIASELLKSNVKNRARHKGIEKEYCKDMEESKFCISESVIGFNKDGELTNGQGRLYACVQSNRSFQNIVYLNLEQNIHMDTGRTRKTVDNIKLSESLVGICNDNAHSIMTVKSLLRLSKHTARVRDEEVIDFCKKHAKIIDKTYNLGLLNLSGGKKAVFKVEIASAILAAAINGVDIEKLVHIRNLLTDGMSVETKDKVILNYREKAFELYGMQSGSVKKQLYYGAQHMIYAYVNGLKGTAIKTDSEYYPIF